MDAFRSKFALEQLSLTNVASWIISLRPKQVTLGSLILSLNRECLHLGDLTDEEGKELTHAFRLVESLLNNTFKPDKINYLALMMVDLQVHFHIIPRYENEVMFKGVRYIDNKWPKPPNLLEDIECDETTIIDIRNYLIDKL